MSKPLFVAISGKKGSGKDTFAQFLKEQLQEVGISACITHFADPLKEMCIQFFGLDRRLVYGSNTDKEQPTTVNWDGFPLRVREKYSIKSPVAFGAGMWGPPRKGPMTHRELLQVMGTDIFRDMVYQNIWAELPFKQKWTTNVVLLPDSRFSNELNETLKNDGIVIRIHRNTGHNDSHPSETALDDYDWSLPKHVLIENNRTLDDLRLQAALQADLIKRRYL